AGVGRMKVAVPWSMFESQCEPAVLAAFQAALEVLRSLGAQIVATKSYELDEIFAALYQILLVEAAAAHLEDLQEHWELYSPQVRVYFASGLLIDGPTYVAALQARKIILDNLLEVLGTSDFIATPTVGFTPQIIAQEARAPGFLSDGVLPIFTGIFSLTGLPAISVPCGFDPAGMPIGLQLATRPLGEENLLAVAGLYESSTPWHWRHPTLTA